ncbi:hypothetical protein Zm00014a_003397 [Zea mays]|uniref:Uncharacterized protein n=1 Tax=Zea mays TaxID=4577 RepID=A0A3L6F7Z3_MAIZE|nr:hypothetical protein Zm00014a_003397 [Zea mays]
MTGREHRTPFGYPLHARGVKRREGMRVPANGEGMEERDAVCGGGKDAYLDLERDVACRARRAVGRHCEAGDGVDAAALGKGEKRGVAPVNRPNIGDGQ